MAHDEESINDLEGLVSDLKRLDDNERIEFVRSLTKSEIVRAERYRARAGSAQSDGTVAVEAEAALALDRFRVNQNANRELLMQPAGAYQWSYALVVARAMARALLLGERAELGLGPVFKDLHRRASRSKALHVEREN